MSERHEIGGGGDGSHSQQAPPMTLPVHRLARYMRVQLEVSDGVLRWDVPRTLLGLVPIGVRHIAIPVADVQSLRVHRAARPFNLVVGACASWCPGPRPLVDRCADVDLGSLGDPGISRSAPRCSHLRRGEGSCNVCFSHQLDAELYMAAVSDLAEQARKGR